MTKTYNYIQEAKKYDMDAMAKDVLIEYDGPVF